MFGEPGEPGELTLLGARSLEGLNLKVDLVGKRLVSAGPMPAAEAIGALINAAPIARCIDSMRVDSGPILRYSASTVFLSFARSNPFARDELLRHRREPDELAAVPERVRAARSVGANDHAIHRARALVR